MDYTEKQVRDVIESSGVEYAEMALRGDENCNRGATGLVEACSFGEPTYHFMHHMMFHLRGDVGDALEEMSEYEFNPLQIGYENMMMFIQGWFIAEHARKVINSKLESGEIDEDQAESALDLISF